MFSKLQRRLHSQNYQVISFAHDREIQTTDYDTCDVFIFLQSGHLFLTRKQVQDFQAFLTQGKSIICLLSGVDKESKNGTVSHPNKDMISMKNLLTSYGIFPENNCVIRTSFHEYPHPKIAHISDGFFHPTFTDYADYGGNVRFNGMSLEPKLEGQSTSDSIHKLTVVYPNGCSFRLKAPAVTILCSGTISSFPAKRSISAVWDGEFARRTQVRNVGADKEVLNLVETIETQNNYSGQGHRCGRLVVVGSSEMFSDTWLEKEDNRKVWDVLLLYCFYEDLSNVGAVTEEANEVNVVTNPRRMFERIEKLYGAPFPTDSRVKRMNSLDLGLVETHEVNTDRTSMIAPDMNNLSTRLKACLQWEWNYQRQCNAPQDTDSDKIAMCKELMNDDILSFGKPHLTARIRAMYQELDVPFEPLSLIRPKWECPMPPLQLAVYGAPFCTHIPCLAIEKFDLDEDLSDTFEKLCRRTNKYTSATTNDMTDSATLSYTKQNDQLESVTCSNIDDLESYVQEVGRDVMGLSDEMCNMGGKEVLYHIFMKVRLLVYYL